MSNTKISQLPTFTGDTTGVYVIVNNSGNTETFKIEYENLSQKSSSFVNAGVDVTLGNLNARIPTSGNRSLQLSTVSGTYNVFGSNIYQAGGVGGSTITYGSPITITTTPTYLAPSNNFIAAGYTDTWILADTDSTISWRITVIIGSGYNNNMISIERLY